MLMKLTACGIFAIILGAAFAPISFSQKITNPNCKQIKTTQNTFAQKAAPKMFVKLTSRGDPIK